jgi:hypothetical protein
MVGLAGLQGHWRARVISSNDNHDGMVTKKTSTSGASESKKHDIIMYNNNQILQLIHIAWVY